MSLGELFINGNGIILWDGRKRKVSLFLWDGGSVKLHQRKVQENIRKFKTQIYRWVSHFSVSVQLYQFSYTVGSVKFSPQLATRPIGDRRSDPLDSLHACGTLLCYFYFICQHQLGS